jgi:hypothetical protein
MRFFPAAATEFLGQAIDMAPGKTGFVLGAFHFPNQGPAFALGVKHPDGTCEIVATSPNIVRAMRDELDRLLASVDAGSFEQPEQAQ